MTYVVSSGDCGELSRSIDDKCLRVCVPNQVSSLKELAPDAGGLMPRFDLENRVFITFFRNLQTTGKQIIFDLLNKQNSTHLDFLAYLVADNQFADWSSERLVLVGFRSCFD